MIYAAPSIRGPHSPLAGKHCCEEHNGSNSKGRRCVLSFQKPWEWLTGQTAPKKKSCLLQLLPFFSCRDLSFYINFPSTKKRLQDYRSRQKSWERESKGRKLWTKAPSEEGDKAQMRNESKWGDAERGRTTRWGTKSHITKSLSISNCSPMSVYDPCANNFPRGASSSGWRDGYRVSRKDSWRSGWLDIGMSVKRCSLLHHISRNAWGKSQLLCSLTLYLLGLKLDVQKGSTHFLVLWSWDQKPAPPEAR